MAHLVEISEEDSWLAVATYIGDLIDDGQQEGSKLVETDGSRFVDKCKQAYDNEQYTELLELFIINLDLLYSKSSNDQDLEGSVNIICHLVPRIRPPGAALAAKKLSAAFASQPTQRQDRRLQALVNLYNVVWDPQSKSAVLLQTLEYSKASGLADIMLSVIRANSDGWPEALQLSISEERALYVACADALKTCTRKPKTAAKEAYRLLSKHIATFEDADAASATNVASQVVIEFIKSQDMYYFDLAENPAIKSLATVKEYAQLHALLTIFLTGTVKEFKQFASKNADLFTSMQFTEKAAEAKMKLLALMGLAYGASEISFRDIAEALDIDVNDVEAIVVQGIGKHLMDGRIDQLQNIVLVNKCLPRTFGSEQWKILQGQLKGWKESVAYVEQLGEDEMNILPRGIAELSITA